MKTVVRNTIFIFILFSPLITFGQIGFDNDSPDASAVLDLNATDKGLLIPRMTTQEREAIDSPANSLLVFDTSVNSYFYYTNNQWVPLSNWSSSASNDDVYLESGNVGIGTASPAYKLDVNGPVNASMLYVNGTPFSANIFPLSNGPLAKTATGDWNDYTVTGFYMGSNMVNASPGSIHQWRYVTVIRHNDNYSIQYSNDFRNDTYSIRAYNGGNWTAWKKIMYSGSAVQTSRLESDSKVSFLGVSSGNAQGVELGNILVADNYASNRSKVPTNGIFAKGSINTEGSINTKTFNLSGNDLLINSKRALVGHVSPNPQVLHINYNTDFSGGTRVHGNLTVTGTLAYSDIRLKDNIQPLKNALDKVMQIEGVIFTRKDLPDNKREYIGVIADDLVNIVPELVHVPENEEHMKSVDYSSMVALLVEAIKEQQKQAEDLNQEIEELRHQIERMKTE